MLSILRDVIKDSWLISEEMERICRFDFLFEMID